MSAYPLRFTDAELAAMPLEQFVDFDIETGLDISGEAQLAQARREVLLTPIGTRVMRRGFGSRLYAGLDTPGDAARSAGIVASCAEAMNAWEPRERVRQVLVNAPERGALHIDLVTERAGRLRTARAL